jgi:hypothetical protein
MYPIVQAGVAANYVLDKNVLSYTHYKNNEWDSFVEPKINDFFIMFVGKGGLGFEISKRVSLEMIFTYSYSTEIGKSFKNISMRAQLTTLFRL